MRKKSAVQGSWVIAMTLVSAAAAEPPKAVTPPSQAAIKILSDVVLPPMLVDAADVRWASDDSVYLALRKKGVVEYSLTQGTTKEIIPGMDKVGGLLARLVAASSQFVVAAPPALSLAWKRPSDPAHVEEAFETARAIDVWQDQVLIVGARRDEKGEFGTDGAIAWRGSLAKGLSDLKPVLYDITGPGARNMIACGTMAISAARFLADGSFILVPGVQPGINLYDTGGKLVRTWDTGSLGIDTDCSSIPADQVTNLLANYQASLAWMNRRRTVDTLLPLRNGAALVLRSVAQGRAGWELKRLFEDGSVQSLSIPIEAGNDFHVRGDVRDGKILLLLYELRPTDYSRPRLIRIQLPPSAGSDPAAPGFWEPYLK